MPAMHPDDALCFGLVSNLSTHQARELRYDWTDTALAERPFPLLRDLYCPVLILALPTGPLPA